MSLGAIPSKNKTCVPGVRGKNFNRKQTRNCHHLGAIKDLLPKLRFGWRLQVLEDIPRPIRILNHSVVGSALEGLRVLIDGGDNDFRRNHIGPLPDASHHAVDLSFAMFHLKEL